MKIRKMKLSDFTEIYQLWKTVGLAVKSLEREKHEMEQVLKLNPSTCLAGIENGKIIATIFGTFNGRRGWIYHLAVDQNWQQKGYGSMLMGKVEKLLKEKGTTKIIAAVAYDNAKTMQFYVKNGYSIMNDAILMAKEL